MRYIIIIYIMYDSMERVAQLYTLNIAANDINYLDTMPHFSTVTTFQLATRQLI